MDETLRRLSPYYEGCLACDQLVDYFPACWKGQKSKSSIVVNTKESRDKTKGAGHFLAIVHGVYEGDGRSRGRRGYIFLYDPLALNYDLDSNVNDYLRKVANLTGWTLTASPRSSQHINSLSCGLHTLAFILHHDAAMAALFHPRSFYAKFHYPANFKNDDIARDLILKYISSIYHGVHDWLSNPRLITKTFCSLIGYFATFLAQCHRLFLGFSQTGCQISLAI